MQGVETNEAGISIHALREEGDTYTLKTTAPSMTFLSTPSARRATLPARLACLFRSISIHALREEGDAVRGCPLHPKVISIHALREEGDFP